MDPQAPVPSAFTPLETPPPELSPGDAEGVVASLFGLIGTATRLESERDLNFRIDTEMGRRYLLKLSNPADDPAVIDMQTHAMLHIGQQDPSLPVMQPLASKEDRYAEPVRAGRGGLVLARLLIYLGGTMADAASLDAPAQRAFGAMVARMGVALRGFFHPAAGYQILWDIKHAGDLRRLIGDIASPSGRRLVERILDRFHEGVAPRLGGLRAQIIHNDLTLDNVLLDPSQQVSGIVDFGDLTHTALICDLAVALVSLMWGRDDPLDAAANGIAGYRSAASLEQGEAELLGDLVLTRLAALVTIAAWRVKRYPENAEYITANVDLAWHLLQRLEDEGPALQQRLVAACIGAPDGLPDSMPPLDALVTRRRELLGPALSPLSYDRPLYLVRGEGCRLYDHAGAGYIDAYNNVPVVGHSHPRVVRAIAEQSATLNTNTRYLHHSAIQLAERLVATMPEGLDTVMFLNSGSEANDLAWRFATAYTGAGGAVVTARAYHGVTTTTLALSPEEWVEEPDNVIAVPAPDGYRGRYRSNEEGWAGRYAAHITDAIAGLDERGCGAAAFYVDSLFTSDGIFSPPPAYLQEVARLLKDAGALLVADEVQAGYGRSGSHLWSFEASGITPDFVTLGKPMGNGHPVAAVITRSEIAERLAAKTDVFSTFGGNPVACRAALAVLDVLEDEGLQERAWVVGARLRALLEELQDRHPAIGDVRGSGLMIGVELVSDRGARTPAPTLANGVMNRMRDKGVLVGSTGPDDNVLKIRPPLAFGTAEAEEVARVLDASLRELEGGLRDERARAGPTA